MKALLLLTLLATGAVLYAGDDLIQIVSHGDRVELAKVLVPGKYTAVEFYADW